MIELVKSANFDRWLSTLRDVRAIARIQVRLDRMASGNLGDVKPVGDGISEMRIDYGPGYRRVFHAARSAGGRAALRGRQIHAGERHRKSQTHCRTVDGLTP